jgi:DNA-binding MarR family transcriptional regulator
VSAFWHSGEVNEQLLTDDDVTLYGLFVEAYACIKPLVHRDLGVPDAWFEVLLRLGRTPEHRLRMTDLAEAVSFSSGGFTRLADRMEKEGLIRREADPNDRRAALAVLTDQGSQALNRALTSHVAQLHAHLTAALSDDDRHHFARILRTLRDANN